MKFNKITTATLFELNGIEGIVTHRNNLYINILWFYSKPCHQAYNKKEFNRIFNQFLTL
jgi:hypothetical protein